MSFEIDENDKEDWIKKTFDYLDKDKDGNIDVKELEIFILNQGLNIPQEEIQELIEAIDINQDGKIQYIEFAQVMEKMINKDDVEALSREIFNLIDRKGDDQITADELKYAFYCLGEMVSDEDIIRLMKYASSKESVSFEDFSKLFNS